MNFEVLTILFLMLALLCLTPISSKYQMIKRVAAAIAVAAVFASVSSFVISNQLATHKGLTSLAVHALNSMNPDAQGTEIWIKGIEVGGVFYAAEEIFKDSNWIKKEGMIGWRNYNQPENLDQTAIGQVPAGENRKLHLEANQWRGNAEIMDSGEKFLIDCFLPQGQSEAKSVLLSSSVTDISAAYSQWFIFGSCFVAGFLILFFIKEKRSTPLTFKAQVRAKESREVWADLLRIICSFAIVVIHATGHLYWNYEQSQRWYMGLFINSITRFAVPCFMMLSGVFILSKEQTVKEVFTKRIPKVLIPLLFWSISYVLLQHYQNSIDFSGTVKKLMQIPVKHQSAHLWFIYQLLGLYLLSPILSQMYRCFDKREIWYFAIVTLLGPSMIDMIFRVLMPNAPGFLEIKWSHIGLAEVGLFVMGRLLLDEMRTRKWAWWWSGIFIFIGFSGIVLGNYFVTLRIGQAYWGFFDQLRLPAVLFAIGVMILFFNLEKRLVQLPDEMKQFITQGSALSLGVYFVHCIPLALYPYNTITKVFLSFVVSYAFCYLMSRIPYMSKLVI